MSSQYVAYLQMPVLLHGEKAEIVETSIVLPVWYQPQPGQFLYHKTVNGLVQIGTVFFDGDRDALVIGIVNAAYDFTTTLEEWLADRPAWTKAATPFLELIRIKPTDDADPAA